MEYDFAVVGSGFGGSAAALRLAEKGYRVAVIEQGGRVTPEDMERASGSVRHLFWMPGMGMRGFFTQRFFRHFNVVGGVGLGGGSIVYAAVLLKPGDDFFSDPSWSGLGVDWKKELAPHYRTVAKMLGVVENPHAGLMDEQLRAAAEAMGVSGTFGPTPNGIYFGKSEVTRVDPFFGGAGPARTGCYLCGECLTGCRYGSKNTLDRNYLYLAERLGAVMITGRKVTDLDPLPGGGYLLSMKDPTRVFSRSSKIRARRVVLAGGVLGTLELLFRCRDVTGSLPGVSPLLGSVVRTNSEAIVGSLSPDPGADLTRGTTISSHFYPDRHTHITQNRFPKGYGFMRWYCGPLVDNDRPLLRSLVTLGRMIVRPSIAARNWFARSWYKRITVLTVMQNHDSRVSVRFGRSAALLFLGRRLKTRRVKGMEAPTNLPVANRAAAAIAEATGGTAVNVVMESLLNQSTTAHILGGCHMGNSSANGVIDHRHEVFGCPGLYVMDGAAVSANVGVNPSLTIAAMAERALSMVPDRKKAPPDFLQGGPGAASLPKWRRALRRASFGAVSVILAAALVTGLFALLPGVSSDGRTPENILGVPAESAGARDALRLSANDAMRLFHASSPARPEDLKGAWKGRLAGHGPLVAVEGFFSDRFFGPGAWVGKVFLPDEGKGFNLFRVNDPSGHEVIWRGRHMRFGPAVSALDGKDCLMVYYDRDGAGGWTALLRDEIRLVNDRLCIGVGYFRSAAGPLNRAPFILWKEGTASDRGER